MLKQFVAIDESGDPGVDGSSTSHFIIAAVVVVNEDNKERLTSTVDEYRRELGWKDTHEFKFNKTKKIIVEELINRIRRLEFSAYAIVLDKSIIPVTPDIISSISLNNYVLKELLVRIELTNPHIIIDGAGGKKSLQRTCSYLRQNLKAKGAGKCEIKFADSRNESLIQVADVIAGSVARSLRDDLKDSKKLLELLDDRIADIYSLEF